jgi:hypothetical protein
LEAGGVVSAHELEEKRAVFPAGTEFCQIGGPAVTPVGEWQPAGRIRPPMEDVEVLEAGKRHIWHTPVDRAIVFA